MRSLTFRCLAFLALSLGAMQMASAQLALIPLGDSQVCWKSSTGRGVGVIPSSCLDGQTKNGLLCYENCKSGYNNEAGVCWSGCPAGTEDWGATCRKKVGYGRGAGDFKEDSCKSSFGKLNDNVNAVTVPEGLIIKLYQAPNLRVSNSERNLFIGEGHINLRDSFNGLYRNDWAGKISSFEVSKANPNGPYSRFDNSKSQVCFYRQADFKQDVKCYQKGSQIKNLEGYWNDEVMSVKIGRGLRVVIWQHSDFQGARRVITGPVKGAAVREIGDLGWFNNRISSFKIEDEVADPQACIYEYADEGGLSVCAGAGGKVMSLPTNDGACEKDGLLWYPKCASGFNGVGPMCHTSAGGINCGSETTDAGLFCTKRSYVVGPKPANCSGDKEYDAGLCYDKCKGENQNGIGPVCWGTCPKVKGSDWTDCGVMCGKSAEDCAKAIAGQTFAALDVVSGIALNFVPGVGAAASSAKAAALAAAKAGLKKAKLVLKVSSVGARNAEMAKLVDSMKRLAAIGQKAWTRETEMSAKIIAASMVELENSQATDEEFDYTAFDPTGIADLVNAFRKPDCNTISDRPAAAPAPAPAVARPVVQQDFGTPGPNNIPAEFALRSNAGAGARVDACMDVLQNVAGTAFANSPQLARKVPIVWECHLGANQRYKYNKDTQQIISSDGGLCFSVLNGFAMRLEDCDARNPVQKWKFESNGYISNVSLKTCINAQSWANGSTTALTTCTPTNGDQISLTGWRIIDATTRVLSPSHASNMCMDFNPQFRQFPVLWQCNGLSTNQKFEFLPSLNGKTLVRHPPTNKCLDMAYQGLEFRDCDVNARTQEFNFTGRDTVMENFGLPNKCVDVAGGGKNNDNRVVPYNCHREANQRWTAR